MFFRPDDEDGGSELWGEKNGNARAREHFTKWIQKRNNPLEEKTRVNILRLLLLLLELEKDKYLICLMKEMN